MKQLRHFAVRRARFFEVLYQRFENGFLALHPLLRRMGYGRIEKPVAAIERLIKSTLFDCKMCGHCVLGSTGMSCPMNCPKSIRNGPCGGVRNDGTCEIIPTMRCVWVDAYTGSQQMRDGAKMIRVYRGSPDQRMRGRSSWLRVIREKAEQAPENQ